MSESSVEKSQLEICATRVKMNYLNSLKIDPMCSTLYKEEKRYRADGDFQRDYARIMYSSSFRRLQGKMQLLGIKNDQFFRNRLTHSLEVEQIARSIASAINYDLSELYVVEAGALAHDIGNPPFGHAGEKFLNEIFSEVGGFEGNAQTLRILTTVEKKRPDFRGLNLNYRTLLSVVKYFNKFSFEDYNRGNKNQKFIYDDDYDLLNKFIIENSIKIRTIDVQIVDIADEIAYAAHDLEDGLRVKAFTIDEILHDYCAEYGKSESYLKFCKIVEESKDKAGYGLSKIDSTEYSKMFRQEVSSKLINLFMNDITLMNISGEKKKVTKTVQTEELSFLRYEELVKGLKKIVFKCINHNDEVYSYEIKGKKVINKLNEVYMSDKLYLPPEYRADEIIEQYKLNDDKEVLKKRLICDYISGMMDSYAISQYKKITGEDIK